MILGKPVNLPYGQAIANRCKILRRGPVKFSCSKPDLPAKSLDTKLLICTRTLTNMDDR